MEEKQIPDIFEKITQANQILCDKYGGLYRDAPKSLLLSVLNSPWIVIFGEELYPGPINKVVKIGQEFIAQHIFSDGNKRVALIAMEIIADMYGLKWDVDQKTKYNIIMNYAQNTSSKLLLFEKDFIQSIGFPRNLEEIIQDNNDVLMALGDPNFEW